MTPAQVILSPLDGVRAELYRLAAPWLRALYADRARRVLWLGLFSVASAFVLTSTVPLWSLALGPVVLGVPHLLADVRYLVVRPGLHRQRWLMLLAGVPLLATSFGAGPVVGVLASLPAIALAEARLHRKVGAALVLATLLLAAWQWNIAFQLVFLHAHNGIALLLWWRLGARPKARAWVVGATVLGVVALLAGVADPLISALGMWNAPATGTSFEAFVETTTPLADPVLAMHLVLVFAFLQSVHYAVWLRLIPDDARERPAPRPFRASWLALREEFGGVALGLVVVAALLVAAWGLLDLAEARGGYLRLAAFHGYLELAVLLRMATGASR